MARSLRALLARVPAFFVSFALAAPAGAFQITGLSVALGGTNTANELVNSGNNRAQIASSVAIASAPGGPVADTPGSSTSFGTRFASLLAVDREGGGGGTTTRSATSAYSITFTVDNPTGGTYQIDIDTLRIGALTNVDDDTGNSTQTLGAVTGRVDAIVEASLALAAVGPVTTSTTGTTSFNQSGTTLSITDSALSRTFVIDFTWTSSATSSKDEAAIRMGTAGSISVATADDYPGVGSRTAANDGHFVDVTATYLVVPEPEPVVLATLGLVGLAIGARRRRAA